jgi:hypothetical protein
MYFGYPGQAWRQTPIKKPNDDFDKKNGAEYTAVKKICTFRP